MSDLVPLLAAMRNLMIDNIGPQIKQQLETVPTAKNSTSLNGQTYAAALSSSTLGAVVEHIETNGSNPHNLTPALVDAYTPEEQDTLLANVDDGAVPLTGMIMVVYYGKEVIPHQYPNDFSLTIEAGVPCYLYGVGKYLPELSIDYTGEPDAIGKTFSIFIDLDSDNDDIRYIVDVPEAYRSEERRV